MEAASLAFSVAQTLFAALKCKELKDIWSLLGFNVDLDSLQNTVGTIKSVLLDFEEKETLNNQDQLYIQRLKGVVYEADDLFDEFNAIAEQQNQLLQHCGTFSRKVRLFFSGFGELGGARKMSKSFKKIKEDLVGVASDSDNFSIRLNNDTVRRRREESSCHVNEKDVIGREQEIKEVVNMLLGPHDGNGVVAIVGAVGFGKTTLAQVVFNLDKVKNEYEFRYWVCVTHQDLNDGFAQTVLARILELHTGQSHTGSVFEHVQSKLRDALQGKKFLLVLDDLWTEDRIQWLDLKNFFEGCEHGSRILITTCSKKTAQIVGSTAFELERLSEEHSWMLLKRMAFQGGSAGPELENIGKKIIRNCGNVPLSIRLIGSFLYGQDKEKWFKYQQRGLSMLKNQGNPIMEIEKLDYLRLSSPLKSCFSYCAVFPKNSVIEKQTLISLWMAHGFAGNQTDEDRYEEFFSSLLQRCFFQDVEFDVFGEIVSCKMQNLVHSLAVDVAGNEICVLNSSRSALNEGIRHVSYHIGDEYLVRNSSKNSIRTYLRADSTMRIDNGTKFTVDELMVKWKFLRVLDLHSVNLHHLPKDIGTLIHLRYLDVSLNPELTELPKSVTRLHYLQTLKIRGCLGLKELPEDFSKLYNIRLFDTIDSGLTSMPSGMSKLTSLSRLSMFVMGVRHSKQKQVSDLQELEALRNLKGKLQVRIKEKYKYAGGSAEGGYLRNLEHLNEIEIRYDGEVDGEETLMEDLQPHHNVKGLTLCGYGGERIPSWANEDNLAKLVQFNVTGCVRLRELSGLGRLLCLKFIEIVNLESLEYMDGRITGQGSSVAEEASLFPFLETANLINLPKLREWRRGSISAVVSLPNLSELKIEKCPNLTCTLVCPKVKNPSLNECIAKLVTKMEENDETGATSASSSCLAAS